MPPNLLAPTVVEGVNQLLMKNILTVLGLFALTAVLAQDMPLQPGKTYKDVTISADHEEKYALALDKNVLYKIVVLQQGVDVVVQMKDKSGKILTEIDSPNGTQGEEAFEFKPELKETYTLCIKRLDDPDSPLTGKVSVTLHKVSKAELARREQIRKELEPENKKTVLTLDIDHFWEAYDNLKICKTHSDSVASFQELYLDRATDGLLDFIKARNLTAEKYVRQVAGFPKFYNSVRQNTYEVKKAAPIIEEVFAHFREIYPAFKPVKVCFAIGVLATGGTVSERFVLIGTEISTSTKDCDLSEFNNNAFSKVLAGDPDIVQRIKNIVSHECVHIQQKNTYDPKAVKCDLLYAVMLEGFCDFVGEMIAGSHINTTVQAYGDLHEDELWKEFKIRLCDEKLSDWLYNYSSSKDRPADLGYYIGYKIAQEYYKNAADKTRALTDIIQMDNPFQFLEKSGYDQKIKKMQ